MDEITAKDLALIQDALDYYSNHVGINVDDVKIKIYCIILKRKSQYSNLEESCR